MPGVAEIRRVEAKFRDLHLWQRIRVVYLYGSMPQDNQDQAIAPNSSGERKIVLATSIAETSLTVEGVRIVIDSGLIRVPRFSPQSFLQGLPLADILENMLTWAQRQELETFFPTHITVPSGSRIPIDYSDPASPKLSVRLQEMFGLMETPCIAKGRIPLTLHLLSPAQRPIQITQDLRSFWQNSYFEVKKDLKGRYPKHHWPDDPLTALPTNRTKKSL